MQTIPSRPVTVLLVEDSGHLRQRLRSLIEEAGVAQVMAEAGTVAAAFGAWATVRPDAVVLDLNLPDGHGVRVLADFKRADPACVVMVFTQFASRETREHCLRLGADHFFDKARDFERIPEVLRELNSTLGKLRTGAGGP